MLHDQLYLNGVPDRVDVDETTICLCRNHISTIGMHFDELLNGLVGTIGCLIK